MSTQTASKVLMVWPKYYLNFNLKFKCDLELQYYPIDKQVCAIKLKIPEEDKKYIYLDPRQLRFVGRLEVADQIVTKFDIVYLSFHNLFLQQYSCICDKRSENKYDT